MAQVNETFADVNHPGSFENFGNYELSADSKCSCCPYGFHVDNSFVNFSDTLKKGKNSRYNTIHGMHGGYSNQNQTNQPPDLIMHHGDGSSVPGIGNDRDSFALFGTRTERRKKKHSKKENALERPPLRSHREYLNLSAADEAALDSVFMSESFDKHQTSPYDRHSLKPKRTDDLIQSFHSTSTDTSVCKHSQCPGCVENEVATYSCPHQQLCCHHNTSCVDCCSDVCCHEDLDCCGISCVTQAPEEPQKFEEPRQPSIEVSPLSMDGQVETIKIEFDPEKVNEIRQYLIKCVNRIHELEAQLRSMPVMQIRNSALREENTLLQHRVENQKMIIDQLNEELRKKNKSTDDMLKLYNTGMQTDPVEHQLKQESENVKVETVDKGCNPIFSHQAINIEQTSSNQNIMSEDIRETRSRRNLVAQIPRYRSKNSEVIEDSRNYKNVGVGDHDIKEFYTLDPNGWKIQDIPEAFYKRLRGNWIASLPKPRVFSTGVSNVPDYRHKLIDATETKKNASIGDHDIHSLYYVQPELASESELPTSFINNLRQRLADEYQPKAIVSSIGVNAVEITRNQMVETETFTDTTGVGSHDVSSLYYLQPHLMQVNDLPPDAVRQLYTDWNSKLPVKPRTSTAGVQRDLETCEQALETDSPVMSSIGVGEHDVSSFYLLEYQPFDCEAELPPELLVYLKEKWYRKWEETIPPKQHLVSTSTTFSRNVHNQSVSTDGLVKYYSIGIGDNDISSVYFLQPENVCIEKEIPYQYIQHLEESLRQSWIQSLPPKPELVNRVVEYRRQCQDKSSATEGQIRRSIGFGDHNIERLYFLDSRNASELDLPSDFVMKLKNEWENANSRKMPVRPRLISRAVVCAPSPVAQVDVGTMSEDPRPAMFDEGVEVDLDDEEWAAIDQKTWSEGHPYSVIGGTNLRSVIERLRYSYRHEKPEFITLLSKMFARQVRTKGVQVSPNMAETSTAYGDLCSSLITRGVGEDTIDAHVISSTDTVSFGTLCKPLTMNKFSSTDSPTSLNKSCNTEKRLRDQSVTYTNPNQVNNIGINTERSKTRSVVVWADLERFDEECGSNDNHFIKETWEELSIYDDQGNIIRTERLPTYTVAQYEAPDISNSLPTREEGGRYEHYYVNHGDSKCSSLTGDHSVGGSSSVPIPIFTGAPESSGAKFRDVTSKPSMDFVPRSPTDSHPHVHVCGNDPATNKVNAWQIRSPHHRDWSSSDGSGDFHIPQTTMESDNMQDLTNPDVKCGDERSTYGVRDGCAREKMNLPSTDRPLEFVSDDIPQGRTGKVADTRNPQSNMTNRGPRDSNPNAQQTKGSNIQSFDANRKNKLSSQSSRDTRQKSGQINVSGVDERLSSVSNTTTQSNSGNVSSGHSVIGGKQESRLPQPSTISRRGGGSNISQPMKGVNTLTSPAKRDGDSSRNNQTRSSRSVTDSQQDEESVSPNSRISSVRDGYDHSTEKGKLGSISVHKFDHESKDRNRPGNNMHGMSSTDKPSGFQHPREVNVPVSVPVNRSRDASGSCQQYPGNVGEAKNLECISDTSRSRAPFSKFQATKNINNPPNAGDHSDIDSISGDQSSNSGSQISDLNSSMNREPQNHEMVSHHTYTQKSSRVVSSKKVVTTSCGLSALGKDHSVSSSLQSDPDELRPLFNSTWSSPENTGSQTHETSSITKSSSHLVAKDGHIVERSSSTEKYTTGGDSMTSQGSDPPTSVVNISLKQSFESDDDSVFLKPSPPTSASHQGLKRNHGRHTSRSMGSRDDECLDYGGGVVESQSSSTPSSPRLPRSIMKRNIEIDTEKQYNTLPLLRKKKGIRFSKDTKSDNVGSRNFGTEETTIEEPPYELEFMKVLERLRDERNFPNRSILEKSTVSPKLRECFRVIADWMEDSTKFTMKQMTEAISNLRREWFVVSAGREADSSRVGGVLEALFQFSPHLLETVVNLVDDNSNTSLHYAVSREQWSIVARLLDTNRVRISRANKAGYTPLMLTALCREVNDTYRSVIKRLLASGHINQGSTSAGQTALMLAASHGRTDMVHLLLESGADPNRRDREGSTALMCASEHGQLEAAKILLGSSHCDPNIKDNDGSTALSIALENKHRDIALLIYSRSNLKEGKSSSMKKS